LRGGLVPNNTSISVNNPQLLFDPSSTLIVTGGTDGIGFHFACFAIRYGCKNLILIPDIKNHYSNQDLSLNDVYNYVEEKNATRTKRREFETRLIIEQLRRATSKYNCDNHNINTSNAFRDVIQDIRIAIEFDIDLTNWKSVQKLFEKRFERKKSNIDKVNIVPIRTSINTLDTILDENEENHNIHDEENSENRVETANTQTNPAKKIRHVDDDPDYDHDDKDVHSDDEDKILHGDNHADNHANATKNISNLNQKNNNNFIQRPPKKSITRKVNAVNPYSYGINMPFGGEVADQKRRQDEENDYNYAKSTDDLGFILPEGIIKSEFEFESEVKARKEDDDQVQHDEIQITNDSNTQTQIQREETNNIEEKEEQGEENEDEEEKYAIRYKSGMNATAPANATATTTEEAKKDFLEFVSPVKQEEAQPQSAVTVIEEPQSAVTVVSDVDSVGTEAQPDSAGTEPDSGILQEGKHDLLCCKRNRKKKDSDYGDNIIFYNSELAKANVVDQAGNGNNNYYNRDSNHSDHSDNSISNASSLNFTLSSNSNSNTNSTDNNRSRGFVDDEPVPKSSSSRFFPPPRYIIHAANFSSSSSSSEIPFNSSWRAKIEGARNLRRAVAELTRDGIIRIEDPNYTSQYNATEEPHHITERLPALIEVEGSHYAYNSTATNDESSSEADQKNEIQNLRFGRNPIARLANHVTPKISKGFKKSGSYTSEKLHLSKDSGVTKNEMTFIEDDNQDASVVAPEPTNDNMSKNDEKNIDRNSIESSEAGQDQNLRFGRNPFARVANHVTPKISRGFEKSRSYTSQKLHLTDDSGVIKNDMTFIEQYNQYARVVVRKPTNKSSVVPKPTNKSKSKSDEKNINNRGSIETSSTQDSTGTPVSFVSTLYQDYIPPTLDLFCAFTSVEGFYGDTDSNSINRSSISDSALVELFKNWRYSYLPSSPSPSSSPTDSTRSTNDYNFALPTLCIDLPLITGVKRLRTTSFPEQDSSDTSSLLDSNSAAFIKSRKRNLTTITASKLEELIFPQIMEAVLQHKRNSVKQGWNTLPPHIMIDSPKNYPVYHSFVKNFSVMEEVYPWWKIERTDNAPLSLTLTSSTSKENHDENVVYNVHIDNHSFHNDTMQVTTAMDNHNVLNAAEADSETQKRITGNHKKHDLQSKKEKEPESQQQVQQQSKTKSMSITKQKPIGGFITIRIPERLNSTHLKRILTEAKHALEETQRSVIGIIFRSFLPGKFCLGWEKNEGGNESDLEALYKLLADNEKVHRCRIPIITLIDGPCKDVGMLFACLSTVTIANRETAGFGFTNQQDSTIVPSSTLLLAFERTVGSNGNGKRTLMRYLLTGDNIGPMEAQRIGLISIVKKDYLDVELECEKICRRLRSMAGIVTGMNHDGGGTSSSGLEKYFKFNCNTLPTTGVIDSNTNSRRINSATVPIRNPNPILRNTAHVDPIESGQLNHFQPKHVSIQAESQTQSNDGNPNPHNNVHATVLNDNTPEFLNSVNEIQTHEGDVATANLDEEDDLQRYMMNLRTTEVSNTNSKSISSSKNNSYMNLRATDVSNATLLSSKNNSYMNLRTTETGDGNDVSSKNNSEYMDLRNTDVSEVGTVTGTDKNEGVSYMDVRETL